MSFPAHYTLPTPASFQVSQSYKFFPTLSDDFKVPLNVWLEITILLRTSMYLTQIYQEAQEELGFSHASSVCKHKKSGIRFQICV